MKNHVAFSSFILLFICLTSCAGTGYITTEPVYVEFGRPLQPSTAHIWISGDWVWQRHTGTYRRNEGYWTIPKPGHSYTEGHWESKRKGKRWMPGKWHK